METIDFSKVILKQLILNKEHPFSMTQLHNEIMEKNPEWNTPAVRSQNLADFKRAFLTIEKEYSNVHRQIYDGRQYLIWSASGPSSSLKSKTEFDYLPIEEDVEKIDYESFVEDFVSKGDYDFISDDYFLDGINTAIHLLVKSGKIEQLERLQMVHKINWNAKNKDGLTPLQIAKASQNIDVVEFLVRAQMQTVIDELKSNIEKQKVINREILDRKLESEKRGNLLHSKNLKLEDDVSFYKMTNIGIFLLFSLIWYFS